MILGEQPREAGTCEGQARASSRVSPRRSGVRHRLDVFLSDPERLLHRVRVFLVPSGSGGVGV